MAPPVKPLAKSTRPMQEYGLVSPVPRLYTARMAYEYDERKSEETLRDRGIDFDFAARLFDGQFIEYEDTRRDYGEERHVAIGAIEKELFAVVYTWRNGRRRIISARRANRRERDAFRRAVT